MTNKTNKQTLTAFIYSRTFRLFALRICTFVVKKYNLFSFFFPGETATGAYSIRSSQNGKIWYCLRKAPLRLLLLFFLMFRRHANEKFTENGASFQFNFGLSTNALCAVHVCMCGGWCTARGKTVYVCKCRKWIFSHLLVIECIWWSYLDILLIFT